MVDIAELTPWIGRKTVVSETIALSPARKLAATLDQARLPMMGDRLPPLWHWIYFTPDAPQSELGSDGHPKLGGFLPPIPLPRRMWAGGRLQFHQPIVIGDEVTRESEILAIQHKSGRQGDLVFVTLIHRLSTPRGLAVSEEQDLVYRQPPAPGVAPAASVSPEAPATAGWREQLSPDPVLLFRYSALTFNAHRIHYDLPYAQNEEAYPGLVVQGPLTATLLVDRLAARDAGRLKGFTFRGQQPLFADAHFFLCGTKGDDGNYELWAESASGAKGMVATAQVEAGDVN